MPDQPQWIDTAAAYSRALSAVIDWCISPGFRRRNALLPAMVRAYRRNVRVSRQPVDRVDKLRKMPLG